MTSPIGKSEWTTCTPRYPSSSCLLHLGRRRQASLHWQLEHEHALDGAGDVIEAARASRQLAAGRRPDHRATEAHLKASRGFVHGPAQRPTPGTWPARSPGARRDALLRSADDARISSASRADYAEAARAVLTGARHEGRIYELAGDEAWTLNDLPAEVSRQTGRTIRTRTCRRRSTRRCCPASACPSGLHRRLPGGMSPPPGGALFDGSRQLSNRLPAVESWRLLRTGYAARAADQHGGIARVAFR